MAGVLCATAAVEIAITYFERRLFYNKLDAELCTAETESTAKSPKVTPFKDESETVVPECSLPKAEQAATSTAANEPKKSESTKVKAVESDSESDSSTSSSTRRERLGSASNGEVVKPTPLTKKKTIEAPKKYGSFQRHNSKTNGFAFAHAEGGDLNHRSLSFVGIRHAVNAFHTGDGVVEIEEKVSRHHTCLNHSPNSPTPITHPPIYLTTAMSARVCM